MPTGHVIAFAETNLQHITLGRALGKARGGQDQGWNMGMLDGTKLIIDVTASVRLGLGPLDKKFMTWFIYAKRGFGSLAYYSREGALAAGKPHYAPSLEIVP